MGENRQISQAEFQIIDVATLLLKRQPNSPLLKCTLGIVTSFQRVS